MIKYCKKCKKKTEYIRRGFGNLNSFVGNARECCLVCESKEDKLIEIIKQKIDIATKEELQEALNYIEEKLK